MLVSDVSLILCPVSVRVLDFGPCFVAVSASCVFFVVVEGDDVGAIAGARDGAGAPAPPHARNVRGPSRPQAGQRWLQGGRNAQARESRVLKAHTVPQ